jgi:hypothetical protein
LREYNLPVVLFAVMAFSAEVSVSMILFFHLEDFGVTVGAFGLVLVHMGFVAEKDGSGAPRGFKLDVPPARFLLLRRGYAECRKGQDADAD